MSIPDEAVEAAAEAMHDRDAYLELFEDAPEHRRARYLDAARGILEVAAPHLMAQAWQAGHTAGDGDQSAMWDARNAGRPAKYADIVTPNPYRGVTQPK
jgi:hypothetical protein